jgi:hypothetical protein
MKLFQSFCRPFRLPFLATLLALAQPTAAVTIYNVGTMPSWDGQTAVTGFEVNSAGGWRSVGQTFRINDGNAQVLSISVPAWGYAPQYATHASQFQIGVAAWGGTHAVGSMLYLSDPLTASGAAWQTFTVNPVNLALQQGQQYVLILAVNNFTQGTHGSMTALGYVPQSAYTEGQYFFLPGLEPGLNSLFADDWLNSNADFAFNIAFMVPEPSASALWLLSGVMLVLGRRRLVRGVGC